MKGREGMEKKKLKWGQTPWDNLSREDLLKTIWRMWSVNNRLYRLWKSAFFNECLNAYILKQAVFVETMNLDKFKCNTDEPEKFSLFYAKGGCGGAALEMYRQVYQEVAENFDMNSLTFFAYADDLLFERNGFDFVSGGWVICPKCHSMAGRNDQSLVGDKCDTRGCDGVLRKLQMEDLRDPAEPHSCAHCSNYAKINGALPDFCPECGREEIGND
jgi:hypothetical protein